ncbi:hypothetical protein CSB37_00455 [bacterium DOLZORAL124_38_8]|nr:MAG: hypothetical protein CSB37_00455 [bacterium DOLZORAL124_38_8]
MKKGTRKIGIILFPSIFWIFLTAVGFGAQSLANTIELVAVFILSLLSAFIPNKWLQWTYVLMILCLIVFCLRLFMPIIPE